ncbi:MAG: hypothetical protein E7176_02940 [Erysipelotrichaceae bacterium]|nr:hypothetical protein [Erysipelotrichaceae bacterium]
MIKLGDYNTLRVIRKSDLGYMLTDGKEEVLMHFKQATKELAADEELSVFIYSDKEKRLTATQQEPTATISKAGYAEVIEVMSGVGVFVNINTPKDILISKDYLPFDEALWPVAGDKLFIRLKVKGNILTGKPLNRFEIKELKANIQYAEREEVLGNVIRIAEKGLGIITVHNMYVFVPNSQFRGSYRLGQEISVIITKNLDGECYGTLNTLKENLIDGDRQIILDYMNEHHGIMKLTAKSSSEDIEKIFRMSRKAFKRAYGGLYKDRIIDFDDDKTFIVK